MEEGAEPVREYQRKLNPEMKEVVRKEIIHLLDAGIIYPVQFIVCLKREDLQ